jgi:hypothetical protein
MCHQLNPFSVLLRTHRISGHYKAQPESGLLTAGNRSSARDPARLCKGCYVSVVELFSPSRVSAGPKPPYCPRLRHVGRFRPGCKFGIGWQRSTQRRANSGPVGGCMRLLLSFTGEPEGRRDRRKPRPSRTSKADIIWCRLWCREFWRGAEYGAIQAAA